MRPRFATMLLATGVLVLSSAAHGQPARGGPQPPSTGKELAPAGRAELTPAQAGALLEAAVKQAGKDSACDEVVDRIEAAVPYAKLGKSQAAPVFLAMQRCAIKTRRWNAVTRATSMLLRIDPSRASPDELIRAQVELGRYERVAPTMKALLKQYPGSARELTTAMTYALCRQERWAECAKAARISLAALAKDGAAPASEAAVKNRISYAQALIGTGDLAAFAEERAALAKALGEGAPVLEQLDARAKTARQLRAWVRWIPAQQLPLGTYHLLGKGQAGAMLTLRLVNHDARERTFRLETEVQGATERAVRTFKVAKGKLVSVELTPPLRLGFEIGKVRAPRAAQLAFKLVELTGGKTQVLFDETPAVEVLPRDYLLTRRKLGADESVATPEHFAAWITPNIKEVEDVLTSAKARLADRTFAGEQRATAPQVKALFDELKARGVTYVMDPAVVSEQVSVQRTRLPADVIKSTNAQCLEGTLLFATLMESIGLRPVVVLVPRHAFVGWWSSRYDGKKPQMVFLETTMVGNATFEEAVARANGRISEEAEAGNLDNGVVQLVDVARLRKLGFTPQPYE